MSTYQIAQLNVGRAVAPLDDPQLADFMAWLAGINALAERSPGFVWRLQGDNGNNTGLKVSEDPQFIVNLSVWESIDDLHAFTYRSNHKGVFARRYDWFERATGPNMVVWWVPAGTRPDVAEALDRLRRLAELGPTAEAFTFKERFPPPGARDEAEPASVA
jgi:heme-degrading monooxygenase HmoA